MANFAKMSSTKLRDLCIAAYEKQMEQLVEAEGSDAKLLQQLKSELKEVNNDDELRVCMLTAAEPNRRMWKSYHAVVHI